MPLHLHSVSHSASPWLMMSDERWWKMFGEWWMNELNEWWKMMAKCQTHPPINRGRKVYCGSCSHYNVVRWRRLWGRKIRLKWRRWRKKKNWRTTVQQRVATRSTTHTTRSHNSQTFSIWYAGLDWIWFDWVNWIEWIDFIQHRQRGHNHPTPHQTKA